MLWIVSTPLGNRGDLSPRARETLAAAHFVLCEDTRRTGQLLASCGVTARELVSLHEHNERQRLPSVLARLQAGEDAALVSDAGTPLVADPGYRLVAACWQTGIAVSPVPGPCAALAALTASGLPPYPFAFLGFLPRRPGDVAAALALYAAIPLTLVWYERKNRVPASLRIAHQVLGERSFCVARELTKVHETFIHGRLGQDVPELSELLGEVTVVVGPPEVTPAAWDAPRVAAEAAALAATGLAPREVARRVARVSGWPAKEVYRILVEEV